MRYYRPFVQTDICFHFCVGWVLDRYWVFVLCALPAFWVSLHGGERPAPVRVPPARPVCTAVGFVSGGPFAFCLVGARFDRGRACGVLRGSVVLCRPRFEKSFVQISSTRLALRVCVVFLGPKLKNRRETSEVT